VLCAWGDATTILRHEISTTYIRILSETENEEILGAYADLLSRASTVMIEEQGVPKDKHTYKYQADLRYIGQAISIPIDIEETSLRANARTHISEVFEVAHEKAFTYRLSSNIELVNLRIIVLEITPEFAVKKVEASQTSDPASEAISGRTKFVYESHVYEDTPIWDRAQLKSGHLVKGPAIISEMDSNTVVLPGYRAEIDHVGNILLWEDKPVLNGVTSTFNGIVNSISDAATGLLDGMTKSLTDEPTSSFVDDYTNNIGKEETLDMVTGRISE
jgi:N-methylhydantoinase A/oxoprolinase/acetone carboxylase beta subunit